MRIEDRGLGGEKMRTGWDLHPRCPYLLGVELTLDWAFRCWIAIPVPFAAPATGPYTE